MKKQSFIIRASNQIASIVCLLGLLTLLTACTFRQSEATHVSYTHEDTTGCVASQQQLSLRDCLTAVHNARLVNAYTLGLLR
jgi:hypothetical protein